MGRYIRRALYTALVAGGLVVVGASSAHAAGEGLLDPVTQGATETSDEAAATRGDLDAGDTVVPPAGTEVETTGEDADVPDTADAATSTGAAIDGDVAEEGTDNAVHDVVSDVDDGGTDAPEAGATDRPAETPVEDLDTDLAVDTDVDAGTDADAGTDQGINADGLVDGVVGRNGILDSLAHADVTGVIDGTLGEDGLVGRLMEGLPPTAEVPAPEEPGTEEPGTEEPGTEEPGTEEPGTEEPGTEEPGTEEPGTEEPGTEEPGVEEPGVEVPGVEVPGIDDPGTEPGTGSPEPGNHTGGGAETPREDVVPTRLGAGAGADRPCSRTGSVSIPDADGVTGTGLPTGALDAAGYGHADSAVGADTTETPDGADTADRVDIGWGDGKKAAPAPSEYDGSILYGGLGDGFQGTLTEPAEVAEPAVVPGTAPTRTGYLITGQLSLISLLLGLGIAALRIRRRWNVV